MEYKMDHKYRGVALIFNHTEFGGSQPRRTRTETDISRLRKAFEDLGFCVRFHEDLKLSEIKNKLLEAAQWYRDEDHADSDCAAVAVLTHGGTKESLSARDQDYDVRTLWEPFVDCRSLEGKPKLFFLQACKAAKGTVGDPGSEVLYTDGDVVDSKHEKKSPVESYAVPSDPDILISYATFEGQYAFRRPGQGSPYIEALCSELAGNSSTMDLVTLLTRVNLRVGQTFLSGHPEERWNKKVQQPCFTSSLTRRLYFRKNGQTPT